MVEDISLQTIPAARLLSFRYDIDRDKPPMAAFRDIAIQLLDEILRLRVNVGDRRPPIAFVAHDIGRVVVKEVSIF